MPSSWSKQRPDDRQSSRGRGEQRISLFVHVPERRRRASVIVASGCCCSCCCSCCLHSIGGIAGALAASGPVHRDSSKVEADEFGSLKSEGFSATGIYWSAVLHLDPGHRVYRSNGSLHHPPRYARHPDSGQRRGLAHRRGICELRKEGQSRSNPQDLRGDARRHRDRHRPDDARAAFWEFGPFDSSVRPSGLWYSGR